MIFNSLSSGMYPSSFLAKILYASRYYNHINIVVSIKRINILTTFALSAVISVSRNFEVKFLFFRSKLDDDSADIVVRSFLVFVEAKRIF